MGTITRKIEDLEPSIYIGNTAGWVVSVANTVAGGSLTSIANSAGWVVSVANTQGTYAISNTLGSYAITNTSGWVVSIANTANNTVQITSGSVYVVNTNPNVTITSGSVYVVNTNMPVTITSGGGMYIVNTQALTARISSGSVYVVNTNSIIQISSGSVYVVNTNPNVTITSGSVYVVNTNMPVTVTSGSFYQVNTGGLSYYDSSFAYDATTKVTPKFASIAVYTNSNNAIVLPVTNKKIRVLSLYLISNSTNNIQWQSDSTSAVALTGVNPLTANMGYVLPFNPHGWFQTNTSTLLNLFVKSIDTIGGCITYIETS